MPPGPAFPIDFLPPSTGLPERRLGLAACPGTVRADVLADLGSLRAARVARLVCLAEDADLVRCRVESYPSLARDAGFELLRLPVADYGIPSSPEALEALFDDLLAGLATGRRTVMHCRAGLGRTGTVAATLLVRLGLAPDAAIKAVRTLRRGSVETREQERFVSDYAAWRQTLGAIQR